MWIMINKKPVCIFKISNISKVIPITADNVCDDFMYGFTGRLVPHRLHTLFGKEIQEQIENLYREFPGYLLTDNEERNRRICQILGIDDKDKPLRYHFYIEYNESKIYSEAYFSEAEAYSALNQLIIVINQITGCLRYIYI